MYPWLFERWDCSRVEDDDIDDKTKKTLQSTTREEGGGEERYGSVEGERTGRRGGDCHHSSSRRS